MERTLIIVKPDGVQRKLIWKIMQRFEDKGFMFTAAKFVKISQEQAQKHYEEHKDKPFFKGLVEFMTGYPVFVAVLEGENAVKVVRQMTGKTNHLEAEMGTIRGDYAIGNNTSHNILHSSDSVENAEREISIFFKDEEILTY
jgi:nucleoside-diphosphate kinase